MLLIRHGQSKFNEVFSVTRQDPGIPDPELTEEGFRQVREAARLLAGRPARGETEIKRLISSPYTRALQTATINPAKFLDKLSDFGTVEKGKIADLVLLDADPVNDVGNTQKISAVFSNGRYYSRAQLDHMLSDIQAYAAAH